VRFFTFTDAQRETLKKKMPELVRCGDPKGTYKTLNEDHRTVGVFNFFIAHKDISDDLAYRITKIVLENNAALVKISCRRQETVIENWNKNAFLPFHPGP
jgi:TRAP-type uncharacterized transport system substrate-binding protein